MSGKDRNQDFDCVEDGIKSAPSSGQTTQEANQEAADTVEDNTNLANKEAYLDDKMDKIDKFSQIYDLDKNEQNELKNMTKKEVEEMIKEERKQRSAAASSTSTGTRS